MTKYVLYVGLANNPPGSKVAEILRETTSQLRESGVIGENDKIVAFPRFDGHTELVVLPELPPQGECKCGGKCGG